MTMPWTARGDLGRRHIQGRVRSVVERGGLRLPTTRWSSNLVVREWASIVARLLAGESQYKLGGMYLEYENVVTPGDPVSVPSLDRSRDVSYYDALSGDRDYLRVPMTAMTRDASDVLLYPHGNVLTCFARSAGVVGVHGLDFGVDFNSTIFGAALVAYGHDSDATQDLILSAYYFPVDEQQLALSPNQAGVEWELTLS